MRNLRLTIAYDGTDFHGWQRQPETPTVQALMEESLRRIIGEPVTVHGSGRTDAGVHAWGQVANFKTDCRIPCLGLEKALNDALPPSVRVREVAEVPESFHARYDARARTYRYRIFQGSICPPFLWRFVHHHPDPLDRGQMAEAARRLEGEHDFTSFAAANDDDDGGEGKSNVRRIFKSQISWRPKTTMIVYEIRGSGFLRHMVRAIVGTLIEVGSGKRAPSDVTRVLEARDRARAGPTAPARGLCLVKVVYDGL